MTATDLRTDTELERQIACDWLCEYGTEADWNRLLDQHHSDQQVRRRFGLWLLEQGQAKGEGYLALSACGRDACGYDHKIKETHSDECPYWHSQSVYDYEQNYLPSYWVTLLDIEGTDSETAPVWGRHKATREEVEEAAAAAFLLLPEERREQLLRGDL